MNLRKYVSMLTLVLILFAGVAAFSMPSNATRNPAQNYETSQVTWETFEKNMNVTTFVAPDGSRDELWHLLRSAEDSIYVEIYGVNNPYILDLIHELHDEKPSLEMKFLLGWNSLGYYNPNKYVANNLTLLGYDVRWTNGSDFNFAHQKFFVIDNETAVVHSGNWAKTSFPETGNKANREWSIAMTDTEVAGSYLSVFDYDWHRGTPYDAGTHGTGEPLSYSQGSSTYSRPFSESGTFSGDMNVTPIFSPETSLQGWLYCINNAQATLDIQIPYFTSFEDGGEVDQIIDAIVAAKERGVTVRIITEEEKDFLEISEHFESHGIPVVWQDSRWFYANHNKAIIVDGRIVLISSINYSDGSISENREAGVIVEHEEIAQWYQQVYDFDWGIGDCDVMDHVNLYWDPNIPKSDSVINVTVYAHELYDSDPARGVEEVILSTRIDDGAWSNHTITDNNFTSPEGQLENYFYEISPQADNTNITVKAYILADSQWHEGMEMVIRVRDSLGSIITTPTTTTTAPPPDMTTIIIAVAVIIAAVVVGFFKKRR
ncbi:MAG: phospholipase D-like domain-containing protein [Promethearchaeia archaeon]